MSLENRTAVPAPGAPAWSRIAASASFRHLLSAKKRFIIPATVFFLIYYFALPILSGYFPDLMSRKVWGHFSAAYVFALTQFPMAWILAGLYLRAAGRHDRQAREALEAGGEGGEAG